MLRRIFENHAAALHDIDRHRDAGPFLDMVEAAVKDRERGSSGGEGYKLVVPLASVMEVVDELLPAAGIVD